MMRRKRRLKVDRSLKPASSATVETDRIEAYCGRAA